MTRRGCGCCNPACKQHSARFDFDFYAAKSATSLNTRTLTLSEEVYRRVREYDPETGKRISTGPNEKVYEQEVPFTDEYMAGADPDGTIYAGNITVFGIDVQSRRIEVLDEQGRKIADRTYTGYLRANGSHNSQVALEYDFSDAYDFGVKNQYGYDRVAKLSLSKSYLGESGVPTSQRARTPAVALASGYKADDFNGFNRDYSVDILLSYQRTRNETVTEGSGIDIHGFVSLTERPKNKEEFQNVIDAAGDPINTADIVPEPDRKGTPSRPNVIPGGAIDNTQFEDQYYEHDITRIIPSGPNNRKSFLVLRGETEGVMLSSTGTLNSYFQDSVISPPVTSVGKAVAEVNDTDYEITPRLYVHDGFGAPAPGYLSHVDNGVAGNNGNVTTIRLSSSENVDYDGNWRKNGWVKVGLNSYEYKKGLKPDNEIDLAYLVERDFFSFNYRDYFLGERENKLKVEFLNADGDVEFAQVFERGVQKLSENVETRETFTVAGIKFSRANHTMDGTLSTYRGLIDGNFNVHKYQSENGDYQETNFWMPEWGEGYATQSHFGYPILYKGKNATASRPLKVQPKRGIYRVTSDGTIRTPNITYGNTNGAGTVEDFFWFMQLDVNVKEGGLYYLPSEISNPQRAKTFKLEDAQWSSSDSIRYDNGFYPSLNLGHDELDYVDDLARYYVKTSGDFVEGNLMSLSENAGDGYGVPSFTGNSMNTCWNYADFGVQFDDGTDIGMISAGASTLLRESLKAGLYPVLNADHTNTANISFLMTAIRTKGALGSLALGRDLGQNEYQELYNSIAQKSEGDAMVIPVKSNWRQSYSSDVRRAADGSFMRMRFRKSHVEIGSFHELDLTTFDYSVGNRWNYKPVAWPEDYDFNGFAKVRFTIMSDDAIPRYVQTNGTSKWEQVPDYTKKDHDKKYDADQLCARGECYHLDPYSTLNYKVASVDFGSSGLEIAPETSVSYAGCGAVFNHSLKKMLGEDFDAHILVTRGREQSRGAYHASNAARANTGSFGRKLENINDTKVNGPSGSLDGTINYGTMFDLEGYTPKEEYNLCFSGGPSLELGESTSGTVNNSFVSTCLASQPRCVIGYTTEYSLLTGQQGDLVSSIQIRNQEIGEADSYTEENGGSCDPYDGSNFLRSMEFLAIAPNIEGYARQLHVGYETVNVSSDFKSQYEGDQILPKNVGMTMDLRTDVELEDPDNEVGPIKSIKLIAEVNWETWTLDRSSAFELAMSESYPELYSDLSSNALGVTPETLSLPTEYAEPCPRYFRSGECQEKLVWSIVSGDYSSCDAFDPDREQVGPGTSGDCEPANCRYTTVIGQVEYDPPEEYISQSGFLNITKTARWGPITVGDSLNTSSMSLTYQDKNTSYETVCYHIDQAVTTYKSSTAWIGEAELPIDFDPLNPPDVSITYKEGSGSYGLQGSLEKLEYSTSETFHEWRRVRSDTELYICEQPLGGRGWIGGDDRYGVHGGQAIGLNETYRDATIKASDIVINLTKREY